MIDDTTAAVAESEVEADEMAETLGATEEDLAAQATEYTRLEQKHYQEIRATEKRVAILKDEYTSFKSKASSAKKLFEEEDRKLRRLIRGGVDPQMGLFDKSESDAEVEVDKDAWKELPLTKLDIPDGVTGKLYDVEIETLGDLSQWMQNDQWWKDIAGVGEKAAEKIADAFAKFWQEHPEFCETENHSDDPEDEDADN